MPLRVLIVEDEPLTTLDMAMVVEDAGHAVVGVVDHMTGALAIAGGTTVNAAIVLARGANGIQTARRLHDDFAVRSLFVAVQINLRREAMQPAWYPFGFVGKPYVEAEIVKASSRVA